MAILQAYKLPLVFVSSFSEKNPPDIKAFFIISSDLTHSCRMCGTDSTMKPSAKMKGKSVELKI